MGLTLKSEYECLQHQTFPMCSVQGNRSSEAAICPGYFFCCSKMSWQSGNCQLIFWNAFWNAPWCSRKGCAAAARWRDRDRFPGRSVGPHRGKFAPKSGSELLFKFAASHLSMWITSFKLYSLSKHKVKVMIKYSHSKIHLYSGTFQWVIKR